MSPHISPLGGAVNPLSPPSYLLRFLSFGIFSPFLLFASVFDKVNNFIQFLLDGCDQSEDHGHAQVLLCLRGCKKMLNT